MEPIFEFLIKWSGVWPWVIPLTTFFFFRSNEKALKPILIFCIAALLLNFAAYYSYKYPKTLPPSLRYNNVYYNSLSILRTILIGWFILRLPQMRIYKYTKYLFAAYLITIFVNFLFFEDFLKLSNWGLAGESVLLLLLCVTYFLGTILDEDTEITARHPEFIICTAISLFESINYFIFLFFYALAESNPMFGFQTMKILKYSNILMGVLFGIALYQSYRRSAKINNPVLTEVHVY